MIKCYPMSFGVLEVGGVTNVRRRWRQLRKLITASFAVKSNTDSDGLFKTAFWIALTYLLRAMCSLSSQSNELMLGQCATIQKSAEMEIPWLGIARCGENVCTVPKRGRWCGQLLTATRMQHRLCQTNVGSYWNQGVQR